MMVDLHTTNILLGIMAVVSILEALAILGAGLAGFLVYRKAVQMVSDIEARQIAPLRAKVDAMLADVQAITARVSQQTERVDQAITGTFDRVDETADRVRGSVREKVNQAIGIVRGVRAVIMSMLHQERRRAA